MTNAANIAWERDRGEGGLHNLYQSLYGLIVTNERAVFQFKRKDGHSSPNRDVELFRFTFHTFTVFFKVRSGKRNIFVDENKWSNLLVARFCARLQWVKKPKSSLQAE